MTVVALASDTLFAFDKAELAPEAVPNLRRTHELIRRSGAGEITVTGHTDAKGDDAYNQELSRRRAQAVVDWLRRQDGLHAPAFKAVGRGATAPIAPNTRSDGSDDPEGRARNRRVEVKIPKQTPAANAGP
jgi:outer membrane protein OmpA-like peptidoglycan-associated protein